MGWLTDLVDDVADVAEDVRDAAANTAHRVVDFAVGEDPRRERRQEREKDDAG